MMDIYTWRGGSNSISFKIMHLYFTESYYIFFKDYLYYHPFTQYNPWYGTPKTSILKTKILP